MKTLILYYTYSQGNTEKIANELKQALNADIEKIETEEQYKGSYDEVVEQGKREVEDQYQPSIKSLNKTLLITIELSLVHLFGGIQWLLLLERF